LYAFLFSPVRHIPGPWWARLSKLPLLRATYERRRSKYASDLLAQYGPVVVIAPDQVHTNDALAMQAIYSRKSLKTPFYSGMGSWKGVTSTLGFVEYKDAAPTRNNLLQIFQNRNLATLVENISSHVTEFCQILDEKLKLGEDVDGVILFRLLALDIVTDVLWGEKNTLLSKGSDGATNQETSAFLKRFHAFSTYNAMKSFIPGFDTYTRFLGTAKWQALRQDCSDMDVTAKEALERWKTDSEHRDRDVLSMMISMDQAVDERKRVPKEHIPAYMVEMLAAGSSTTSHTATFTCFELANHPDVQSKLHRELVDKFPGVADIDQKQMMDLPYLDAVIRETMRLMPMIPGMFDCPITRLLVANTMVRTGPLERYLVDAVEVNGLQVSVTMRD
jgi:cytochrome P450